MDRVKRNKVGGQIVPTIRTTTTTFTTTITLIISLLILSSSLSVSSTRIIRRQISSSDNGKMNMFDNNDDLSPTSFFNMSELKNLDLTQLLEINFINKSVNHYHGKLKQVQSSLRDRVKSMIADVRGAGFGSKSNFSPELRQKLNNTFLKFIEELELSPYCLASLNHLRVEMGERRLWPLRFLDAMELLPTGTIEGVLSSVGLYEECINIASPMVKWNDIRGKYCLAKVRLPFMDPSFPEPSDLEIESRPLNKSIDINRLSSYAKKKLLLEKLNVDFDILNNKLKLLQMINMLKGSYYRVGLCFPSTCSASELERAFNKFLEPFQNPIRIEIEDKCSVLDQELVLNNYQRVAIIVLVAFGFLVGISTCYEYYLTNIRNNDDVNKSNVYDRYLITFSAISNTRSLFDESSTDRRLFFYGMMNIKRPLNGLPKEYFTARKFFFIRGSSFAACTYVLASGIILAYNICAYKQASKLSATFYIKFVVNRWFSYARRLIGPILLVYLIPLIGDGPFWHYYEQIYSDPCKYNLLPTFLFYSNYASSLDQVCIPPSVILSTLFYLSLLAPFILFLYNYKMIGYVVLFSLIVIGSIASVIPKFVFGLPVAPFEISTMSSVAQAKLSFIHYFAGTDQLLVVFAIGLFIGFLIKCKPNINLGTTFTKLMLWVGMLILPFISTHWNEGFKPLEGNFSQFSFVAWFILSKIMWSCGFGWLMFACCTGRGGPINDLMSMQIVRPIARLAFGVYLNHITILSFRQLSKKELGPLTHIEILTDDISDLVIAFAVSYAFYIMIERPFYHWIKIIFQLSTEETSKQLTKRFSANDLENGKLGQKEEIDLKPLNDPMNIRH
ncbi:hypothetical protein BLOT_012578 [Blomia tropicalis]|nr:hypothetical protein BLOT_012578 [Blomia tropicalis]